MYKIIRIDGTKSTKTGIFVRINQDLGGCPEFKETVTSYSRTCYPLQSYRFEEIFKTETRSGAGTRRIQRISIPIDFDSPDAGYASLQTLFPFLLKQIQKGNNLLQTYKPFNPHKTTLCLQAKRFTKWTIHPTWNEIKCKSKSDWLKMSPCDIGKNKKIFIKYKSNSHVAGFGLYLWMMMAGEITLEKHKEFVKLLQTFDNVIIHNEEVDWVHLKEYV